jgi:hypothetical protein
MEEAATPISIPKPARILIGDRRHLQPLEYEHGLSERLGLASRLGRFAISLEDGSSRGYLRWGILPSIAQADYALCERALEMDSHNVRALAILAVRSQARITNLVTLDPKSDLRIADEYSARALARPR